MLIAGLSGANGLDRELSRLTGIHLVNVETKLFPDGESYIRFTEELSGQDLIIVQTLYPNQDKKFLELLLAVDAAKDLGCRDVIVVVPYLAYSRQDKAFLRGEAISIKTLLKTLSYVGANYLITIDIHKEESLKYFKGTSVNLDPTPLYASVIKRECRNPVIVAPDQGAASKATKLTQMLGYGDYVVFKKFRDKVTGDIKHEFTDAVVNGRDAVIVDDIISTGLTIANIAQYLIKQGASKVYVVCSHGLFVGNALEKLTSSGVYEIYSLNTVALPNGVKVLDSAPLIANALSNILNLKRGYGG